MDPPRGQGLADASSAWTDEVRSAVNFFGGFGFGGDWNIWIMTFHMLGISSSQLNSSFSEG